MSSIPEAFQLDGQVALVTGASFGLGYGMAAGLAEAGSDIIAVSRSIENLANIEQTVRQMGRACLPIACHVGDRTQVKAMVAQTLDRFGRIDVLVNNAGIIRRTQATEFSEADWQDVLDVNLNGVWYCCQEVGRGMVDRKHGKIINIGSVLSYQGGVTVPSYAASKGALAQLTMNGLHRALMSTVSHLDIASRTIRTHYVMIPNELRLFWHAYQQPDGDCRKI